MSTKAIALLRVSSEAQAGPERQGLPAQREVCARIAETHQLEVIEWVELEGVSGAAVLAEPRFARVLEHLRAGRAQAVIAADFDRLFRRGRFADYAILDAFSETGSVLFTAGGVFNPGEDAGALLSVLQGELSGQERRRIIERTRRGRERKRREKGVRAEGPVGLPRGVTFNRQRGWSYLFPEAERVREVFRLWLSAEGTRSFAEIARIGGIGSGSASNRSWAIRGILQQPLYKGVYRVDRRWVDGRPVPRPAEECYEHVVLDPPLVPAEEWARAQELLQALRPTRPPRRDPDDQDGVYSGAADCAECGCHLWSRPGVWRTTSAGNPSWERPQYYCPTRGCPTGNISIRLADPAIDRALATRLGTPEVLERLVAETLREVAGRASEAPAEVTRRLTELSNKRRRLIDAHVAGLVDLRDTQKRAAAVDSERASLEALAARQTEAIELDEGVLEALVAVFSSWPSLTRVQKRAVLRDFQIRVRVRKLAPPAGTRRVLDVASVRIGVFRDDFSIYKKMKRFGIE